MFIVPLDDSVARSAYVLFCAKYIRSACAMRQVVLDARGANGLRRHHPRTGEAIFKSKDRCDNQAPQSPAIPISPFHTRFLINQLYADPFRCGDRRAACAVSGNSSRGVLGSFPSGQLQVQDAPSANRTSRRCILSRLGESECPIEIASMYEYDFKRLW